MKYWEKVIKPIYLEIKKKPKSDQIICLMWLGFLAVLLYPVYLFRMAFG